MITINTRINILWLSVTMLHSCVCLADEQPAPPNVLFIAVDDLRPELNCYGKTHIHSPNIDALAGNGVLFERAYCMVPTCGASRASLMSGLRPTRNRFVTYLANSQKEVPDITTLNTHFRNHGYHTISNGKVFHHVGDQLKGWSERPWRPKVSGYRLPRNLEILREQSKSQRRQRRGPAYESADAPDEDYADGRIATRAIADLRRLKEKKNPFFLAVGFVKPHLPFVAPKKYWDLYDRDKIRLPDNYNIPEAAPTVAIHSSGELRAYHKIPSKGPVTEETARSLMHGYYACVSFVDAQIGKVLQELKQLGLDDNTIVVLWGDHGWNLGDHTLWCKHSCFESSMHAPLIVRAPGIQGGMRTRGLTEFIDIYPSLCELAGIEAPSHLQGQSFVTLLRDPSAAWKTQAIGRFQSGDTIRTDQHRFTQYSTRTGKPIAQMLYDHHHDPLENTNVVEQATNAQLVESLAADLQQKMGHDDE